MLPTTNSTNLPVYSSYIYLSLTKEEGAAGGPIFVEERGASEKNFKCVTYVGLKSISNSFWLTFLKCDPLKPTFCQQKTVILKIFAK